MAGLMKGEFQEEILTEFSWMMRVIEDLCARTNLETYEIVLLKNRVQMQEERAIDQFFALHFKILDTLTIADIQQEIAQSFFEATQKEWVLSDDLVAKLIQLKRRSLEI